MTNFPVVVTPQYGFPVERRGFRVIRVNNGMVRSEHESPDDAAYYRDVANRHRPNRFVVTDERGRVISPE